MGVPLFDVNDYRTVLPRMASPVATVEVPLRAVSGLKESGSRPNTNRLESGEGTERARRPVRVTGKGLWEMLAGEEIEDLLHLANVQYRNGNLASSAHFMRRAYRAAQDASGRAEGLSGTAFDFEVPALEASPDTLLMSPEGARTATYARQQVAVPVDLGEWADESKFFLFRSTTEFMTYRPPETGLRLSTYA